MAQSTQANHSPDTDLKGKTQLVKIVTIPFGPQPIKPDMAIDLLEHLRFSNEDIFSYVPMLLAAGHETTGSAAWCLFILTQAHEVWIQEELFMLPTDASPWTNSICWHTATILCVRLHMHVLVPPSSKQEMKDNIIPLNKPFKNIDSSYAVFE
ncbi:hypothetical protein OBBRIDRAFT_807365 [Obba rivulosa]|uniref:Uncharacterized protein n=1 Tax=Obba rivulosa TaxID=1052685 RepID=A0A8E2ALQ6_9APHY|nr:hypothetical protein OBBRIDRAFT_807365 [Obba rivulosa]